LRYWSILFALAAVFSVVALAYSPFSPDWWLPLKGSPEHVVSTFGREIDSLFVIILVITGVVFIGTQIVLVWASYKFADVRDSEGRPVRKAQYFHGSQRLEVIWTIIPAAILVFIALYQMGTWAAITIPVWFDCDTAGDDYELVCAELCGWGHYKMRAKVTVHETEAQFQKWLDDQLLEQNRSQLTMAAGPEGR
jgi:heme/copper-type cytochrome/quinol oxidase subunit 2